MAEACNRAKADCWICVPHKFSDSDITAMANDLDTYLDSSRKVYVEYGNEVWNSASPWSDEFHWCRLRDTAAEKATNLGGGTFQLASHGFTDGDIIYTFNSDDNSVGWPWGFGAPFYIKAETADTFTVWNSDLTVQRIPTADQDSYMSTLLFKRYNNEEWYIPENSAERHVKCWDLFSAVFGDDRIVRVGNTWHSVAGVWTQRMMNYGRFREEYDLLSVAPYFNMESPSPDILAKTDEEIASSCENRFRTVQDC